MFDSLDYCLIQIKNGHFKDRRKKKILLIDKIYSFLFPIFYKDRREKCNADNIKKKIRFNNLFKNKYF